MTELLRVQKRYENPENSMEAFILAGVHATLKAREAENHSLHCSPSSHWELLLGGRVMSETKIL